jgi:hypothetical protein
MDPTWFDDFARLAAAGERGTLALVGEVGGRESPIATRRVEPGIAG